MVDLTQFGQYVVNGVVVGSILSLTAVGLTLVYGILRLANFAHGDLITLGAYLALFFSALLGQPRTVLWAGGLMALLLLLPLGDLFILRLRGGEARALLSGTETLALLYCAALLGAILVALRWPIRIPAPVALAVALVPVTGAAWLGSFRGREARSRAKLPLLLGALASLVVALLARGLSGDASGPAAWSGPVAWALVVLLAGALVAPGRPALGRPFAAGLAATGLLAAYLFGGPLLLGVALAVALVALVSMALDVAVWRVMRAKRAGLVTLIVISIGLALVLRNAVILQWGESVRGFPGTVSRAQPLLGTGVFVTPNELLAVGAALAAVLLLHLLLQHTKVGKGMRALADDMDLARITGIDVDRVILYVWAIAGGLAALAGVLLGVNRPIHPNLGWFTLLPVFAAVILGGIGSPYGAVAGGLLIGLVMEVSVFFGVPVAYKMVVAFAVLILVLLWRPRGLLAGRMTA